MNIKTRFNAKRMIGIIVGGVWVLYIFRLINMGLANLREFDEEKPQVIVSCVN